jgi:hypothetical protein
MPKADPQRLVDRAFQLVVMEVPTVLAAAEGDVRRALCNRLERLLDLQVRIAFLGTDDECVVELCKNIGGLAKVFMFLWTNDAELLGFNQWGKPVRLARGDGATVADGPRYVIDAVAEPAEIGLDDILVLAEAFEEGHPAHGFLAPEFQGARMVAMTNLRKRPPGVKCVPPEPDVLVAVLDAVLWQAG